MCESDGGSRAHLLPFRYSFPFHDSMYFRRHRVVVVQLKIRAVLFRAMTHVKYYYSYFFAATTAAVAAAVATAVSHPYYGIFSSFRILLLLHVCCYYFHLAFCSNHFSLAHSKRNYSRARNATMLRELKRQTHMERAIVWCFSVSFSMRNIPWERSIQMKCGTRALSSTQSLLVSPWSLHRVNIHLFSDSDTHLCWIAFFSLLYFSSSSSLSLLPQSNEYALEWRN